MITKHSHAKRFYSARLNGVKTTVCQMDRRIYMTMIMRCCWFKCFYELQIIHGTHRVAATNYARYFHLNKCDMIVAGRHLQHFHSNRFYTFRLPGASRRNPRAHPFMMNIRKIRKKLMMPGNLVSENSEGRQNAVSTEHEQKDNADADDE